jgi:4-aminobutyrate aminotransferase/(S)-3-amino-2-methylpropionate transaminase
MINLIDQHKLVDHTSKIGQLLAGNFRQILSSTPHAQNLRGDTKGTFMSWDFETPALRDGFVGKMRKEGVQMGGCGERSVRLRPMLTFGEKHVEVLCERVERVLKGM